MQSVPEDQWNGNQSTYVVNGLMQMVACNEEYIKFAFRNGGKQILSQWCRGCNVLSCVPGVLSTKISRLYLRAFQGEESRYRYFCHSPEYFREYEMQLRPLGGELVSVTHVLLRERRFEKIEIEEYPNSRELLEGIFQCVNCRKIRSPSVTYRWIWNRRFLQKVFPNVKHVLCPDCAAFV